MKNDKKEFKISPLRRFLIILGNSVLILLVLIGVLIGFSLLPIKNNFKVMSVMSGSMEPTLPVGSLIVVKPSSEYKVGEIITFLPLNAKTKKENVTHRISMIDESSGNEFFQTKGDANKDPDEENITQDRIIGKFEFKILYLGYILSYVKTLPGLLIIIFIPSIIIVYEEVRKIHKEAKNILAKHRQRKVDQYKSIKVNGGKKNSNKIKVINNKRG